MIRILHIIESLGRGGAERRLVNDLKYINGTKFKNIVCALTPPLDLMDEIERLNIETICLNNKNKISVKSFFKLRDIIKINKIDIVHSHLLYSDLYATILRLTGIKIRVVSSAQATPYDNKDTSLYSRKRKIIEKFFLVPRFDHIIAVSNQVKKSGIKNLTYDEEKCTTIFNSVDIERFSTHNLEDTFHLKKNLNLSENDKIVVCIGRLVPPKGHKFLLKALKLVISKLGTTKLLIVGEGPLKNELKQLAQQLNISQYVLFLGKRKDISNLMHLSHLFVFPSTHGEGLPLILLEAMATKKICITADTPPIKEVIRHKENGFLYKSQNYIELSEAIIYVLKNYNNLGTIGENALHSVQKKFSAASSVKKLETVYEKLLIKR